MNEQLTIAIAGAYIGCEVIYPNIEGGTRRAQLSGVDIKDNLIITTFKRKRKNVIGDYLSFKSNGNHNCDALHAKLILIPPDEMPFEVAFKASKILNSHHDLGIDDLDVFREWMYEIFNGNAEAYAGGVDEQQFRELIDLLRPLEIDCGHGPINSLIAANLAVDKTTMK